MRGTNTKISVALMGLGAMGSGNLGYAINLPRWCVRACARAGAAASRHACNRRPRPARMLGGGQVLEYTHPTDQRF
ncbi:MAG TPA: hypothetical protein VE621_04140 [Bryobacteraceae bacterium]|nr:hypothetical protein [Bryobacteraceae bacterium]